MSELNVTKQKSLKNSLGYVFFVAAFVFLANPCLNVVDILPDFLGYIFLLKGLEKWADLCPNVRDAAESLTKLKWLMLLKFGAMLLVPLVDDTYVLVFTFSFAIIELIFVLPAINRIFMGLEYFGTRFESNAIFNGLDNIAALTKIFFVVKASLSVLPELCSLSSYEYSGLVTSTVQFNIADYKNLFILVHLFITSILSIIWLTLIIIYTQKIFKEKTFLEAIATIYQEEIVSDKGLFIRRKLRGVISLLVVGALFFANVWIDGMNVVPTFIGSLFILSAILTLRKITKVAKYTVISSASFVVFSAISFALSTAFCAKFTLGDIERSFEAYDLYTFGQIAAIIEHVAMALSVVLIFIELKKFIKNTLAPSKDIKDSRLSDVYNNQLKEALGKINISLIIFSASVIASLGYILYRAEISSAYWLIPLVLSILLFANLYITLNNLYEQIEYKLM